jgi:hypothetical protein
MATLVSLVVREGVLFLGLGAEDMTDAEFREREDFYLVRVMAELAAEFPGVKIEHDYDRRVDGRLSHYAETSGDGLSFREEEHIQDRIRDALGRAYVSACEVSL